MVSHPLRATPAAASHSALTGARASLARKSSPARPACGLAQRRTPAGLARCPHTAPSFAQPLARRLHARLPPRIPSLVGREPPRASKTRGGLLPQNSELRLGIIYSVRCHLYRLYHRSYGSLSFISFACERVSPPSPTACDRTRRSMIACIAPRPRIYINKLCPHFPTRRVLRTARRPAFSCMAPSV